MSSDPPNKDQPNDDLSTSYTLKTPRLSLTHIDLFLKIKTICSQLNKLGVHSTNYLLAAGFKYTGDGDKAKCDDCGLEVSHWTTDMDPFAIHSKQSRRCSFIRSLNVTQLTSASASATVIRHLSTPNEQGNSSQHRAAGANMVNLQNILFEANILQQVRRRTFSHWPHRTSPSSAQMIEAGFFNCNVGDRVICIYCNLICQQWTPHTDDPCKVHKTLSPNCIYVKSKIIRPAASSIVIVNKSSPGLVMGNHSPATNNLHPLRSNEIVNTAAINPAYTEIPKRDASVATWAHEDLPPVHDLVRAGFFYTGTKNIVRCFYCNGSLQNWGLNDNPMIEHARWFPHCTYARQLCGDELCRKIQEAQQGHVIANELEEKTGASDNLTTNSGQLHIPDESTLSRLLADRLDLPVSRSLLDRSFKLSIIKRCWEDQLLLKHDDFASDCDLYLACAILQKQIEHINDNKKNIVVPSERMKQIREQASKEQIEVLRQRQAARVLALHGATQSRSPNVLNNTVVEITTSKENQEESKTINPTIAITNNQEQSENSVPSNPCVLCLTEEKRLACLPCGHLTTCAPCAHSLRSCPTCGRGIKAFVRIYT